MDQNEYLEMLVDEGFPAPVLVVRETQGFLDSHTHPFEVKALVSHGQIDIVIDGVRRVYLVGDVFHLLQNQIHSEIYGEQGVTYLASRKEPS